VYCTDQVIGRDDVDKRKVDGQEVNIVTVCGSGVLQCTWSPFVEVAFCSVHGRRLWKWRSVVYMVAVFGSGVLQCTWSPFVEVAFCSVHSRRLWKWHFAVYIVDCRQVGVVAVLDSGRSGGLTSLQKHIAGFPSKLS